MKSRSTAFLPKTARITDSRGLRASLAPQSVVLACVFLAACGARPARETCGFALGKHAEDAERRSRSLEAKTAVEATLKERLTAFARTRGHRLGMPTSLKWTRDGSALLFLRAASATDPSQVLFEFDVATGQTRELVTPAVLLSGSAETVSAEEKARRERLRIQARGIVSYDLSEDGTLVLVPLAGRIFVFDRTKKTARPLALPEGAFDPHLSPDGTHVAYVRDYNLYSAPTSETPGPKGGERALTTGGTAELSYGMAEFAAQEELDRTRGLWFSPDGTEILYEAADVRGVEKWVVPDLAKPEREPTVARYPRSGKANAKVRFGIVPTRGGKTRFLDLPGQVEYVAQVSWQKGHAPTLTLLDRLQKKLRVWSPGANEPLATREDPSWVDVDESSPRWSPNGALLWNADVERLEVRAPQGPSRVVGSPEVRYQKLLGTSSDGAEVFFLGGNRPTASAVYRWKDGNVSPVTDPAKNVSDAVLSSDGTRLAIYTTGLDAWPTWSVRSTGEGTAGKAVALPNVATFPTELPRVEMREIGSRHMKAALVWPRWKESSAPAGQHELIDAAYGGPHVNVVTESALAFVRAQWIADATGAVVLTVDGRGTPRRGKEWERAIAGHLGDVPLADHVDAVKALQAESGASFDKVGIYGWSFGGYLAAMAATRRSDVFGAAMAGAPVVDFRDYDACYTERYLGTSDLDTAPFVEASVLTGLKERTKISPLLLFHGTADDNVYISHTLKLTDALARAGHAFTFKPLSGMTHAVSDPELNEKLWFDTAAFFQKALR